MFYQILLSPQVKRCVIVTYKYGICELPHELPNDLRLRIVSTSKNGSPVPSLLAKMEVLLILEENSSKIEIKLFQLCAISHEN